MEPLKRERHDYGSAHAYADAWRKWMADTHAWYAFHHMMAAQVQHYPFRKLFSEISSEISNGIIVSAVFSAEIQRILHF